MAECTPTGGGVTGKALPKEGTKRLKEEIFKLFLNIRGVLSSLSQHDETARGLWSNAVGAFVGRPRETSEQIILTNINHTCI